MRIVRKVTAYLESLNRGLALMAGVFLATIMLIVTFEVIARYVFDKPTSWSVELSTYLLIYLTFFSAAYILQIEGNIYVDFVVSRLPETTQNALKVITFALILLVAVVLTWKGWELFLKAYTLGWRCESGVLKWPLSPVYLVIPIGSAFLSLAAIAKVWQYLQVWLGNKTRSSG